MINASAPITAPVIAPTGDFFDPPDDVAPPVLPVADEEGSDVDVTLTPEGVNSGVVSELSNSKRSNWNSVLPFALEPRFVTTIVWNVSRRSGEA
jgi:hypothetical protein